MPTTLEKLQRLRQFMTRERWIQNDYFRKNGLRYEEWNTDDSCQFCLQGAIFHLFKDNYADVTIAIEKYILQKYGSPWNIPTVNDRLCKQVNDVHSVIEGSIALLEKETPNVNCQG